MVGIIPKAVEEEEYWIELKCWLARKERKERQEGWRLKASS